MTRQELRELDRQLLEKKRTLTGDIELLRQEAGAGEANVPGNGSGLAYDDPDLPIEMAIAETRTQLLENELGLLQEVEDALRRVEDGTYGLCMATGKPISKARLRAIPWARYCAEHARDLERARPRWNRH